MLWHPQWPKSPQKSEKKKSSSVSLGGVEPFKSVVKKENITLNQRLKALYGVVHFCPQVLSNGT